MSNKSRYLQTWKFQESLFDTTCSDFELHQNLARESKGKAFSSTYRNFCSNQENEGVFCISQGFLAHFNEGLCGSLMFLQNLAYARFYTVERDFEYRVVFKKAQAFFELAFSEREMFDSFVREIKKICICTDFDEKYRITKFVEDGKKPQACIVESNIDRTTFTAKIFEKKTLQDIQRKRTLINEIEALRAIQGQGVFELYEVHETEKNICLVTEFIHKDTLHNLLQTVNPSSHLLSRSTIQRIMFNIFQALSTLASFGIIHRNIKPSNILIEDEANIKIINFGLVTCNSAPMTSFKVCGTPGYAAPEIFNNNGNYNEKCDVFSAGCIFFEMLFGYPLFEELFSGSLSFNKVTMIDIKQSVYSAISKRRDRVNSEGLYLLFSLLETDPEDRISAEDALKHPYFKTLRQKKADEETNILNDPLDKPLALPNVHEKFFSTMKASAYMETQYSSNKETEATSDDESEANIESDSDENITTFEKYSIRNRKLSPASH